LDFLPQDVYQIASFFSIKPVNYYMFPYSLQYVCLLSSFNLNVKTSRILDPFEVAHASSSYSLHYKTLRPTKHQKPYFPCGKKISRSYIAPEV
ncbi:hypothetical protein J6590_078850, partial [Homalodisca vitripennis]